MGFTSISGAVLKASMLLLLSDGMTTIPAGYARTAGEPGGAREDGSE